MKNFLPNFHCKELIQNRFLKTNMQLKWLAKYQKIEQSVLRTPLYLQDLNAIENIISFYMQEQKKQR